MKIYIDFDDVLCETARSYVEIVKHMFDLDTPYEHVKWFDLKRSFDLNDDQFKAMMTEAHLPKVLLTLEETPGAVATVRGWLKEGHEISVITGRPSASYEPSRQWLDEHGLGQAALYCVNKYGRDSFIKNSTFSIELEEYYKMHFDFAVEDSPAAFQHLKHLSDCRVAVIDRPWNQAAELPNEKYKRCVNWEEIDRYFRRCM